MVDFNFDKMVGAIILGNLLTAVIVGVLSFLICQSVFGETNNERIERQMSQSATEVYWQRIFEAEGNRIVAKK